MGKKSIIFYGKKSKIKKFLIKTGKNGLIFGIKLNYVFVNKTNKNIYQAQEKKYLKNKNPREKVIISNWLVKPFKTNYFDVVLADEILNNLALKTHNQYF